MALRICSLSCSREPLVLAPNMQSASEIQVTKETSRKSAFYSKPPCLVVVFLLSVKARVAHKNTSLEVASKTHVTKAFTGRSVHNAVSSHKSLTQALPVIHKSLTQALPLAARHKAVALHALPLTKQVVCVRTLLARALHCCITADSIPPPASTEIFRRASAIADEEVAEGTAAAARGIEIGGGGAIAGACCGADGDADDAADAADAAVDDVDYVDAVGVASTWWDTHRDTHRSYAVVVPDGAAAEPCGAGDEAQAAAHAHAHAHAHAPVPPAMGLLLRLGRHLAGVPAAASVAAAGQGDAVWPLADFGSRFVASSSHLYPSASRRTAASSSACFRACCRTLFSSAS